MAEVTTRRRRGMRWAGLVAVLAVTACGGNPTPPPVVRVDRGLVATSVTASGTLVSITEQNLGFADPGQVSEVLVKVGDRVEAGQILARLDDFELQNIRDSAQAQVDQAQAMLDKVRNSNSVEAAQANLDQAREVLGATEDQVDATNELDDVTTERARVQLDFDRSVLARAEDALRQCRANPAPPTTSTSMSPSPGGGTSMTPASPSPAPSGGLLGMGGGGGGSGGSPSGGGGGGMITSCTPEQQAQLEQAVIQAKSTVIASRTALETAEQRERVDEASGRLSIEQARTAVVTAENNLQLAGTDRPADTAAQAAAVRDLQAALATAQRDLDAAALRAPTGGIVSAINGTVGEFVQAASTTTPLAPGSLARLPGLADNTGGGSGGASAAAPAPGAGAFIVLNNVDSYQLVVPFEESDAARIAPNQRVNVTVDAVPGLVAPATVLAVSPTGDEVSGIVNYYATVVLTQSDPKLRDGQTGDADVQVEAVDGVLRVPSSTVRTENGGTVVSTLDAEGNIVTTPFEAGTMGDEFTEVRSGLREGQDVVLPQGQVASIDDGQPDN